MASRSKGRSFTTRPSIINLYETVLIRLHQQNYCFWVVITSTIGGTCPAPRHVKKFMILLLLVKIPSGEYSSQFLHFLGRVYVQKAIEGEKEEKDNSLIDKKSCSAQLVEWKRRAKTGINKRRSIRRCVGTRQCCTWLSIFVAVPPSIIIPKMIFCVVNSKTCCIVLLCYMTSGHEWKRSARLLSMSQPHTHTRRSLIVKPITSGWEKTYENNFAQVLNTYVRTIMSKKIHFSPLAFFQLYRQLRIHQNELYK